MDRKGDFDLTKEWLIWIVRAIVFFVVISVVVIIIYIPISLSYNLEGVQHSLLRQHLISDKNCLAYEDSRVYPGTVDINKFTQANLEKCFDSTRYAVRLSLMTNPTNTITLNERLAKFEFCFDNKNFYCTSRTFYVLLENAEVEQGLLNMEILNQK